MNRRGMAHHARAAKTLAVVGSRAAGTRTDPAVVQDRQRRQELEEHRSAAVRELGRVVVASAGTSRLLAQPLIWTSGAGEEPPSWRALALSDLFLVYVELTVTEAERMKTFASVVHFMDVADVKATSQIDDAGVTLRFGSGDVTVPWRELQRSATTDGAGLLGCRHVAAGDITLRRPCSWTARQPRP